MAWKFNQVRSHCHPRRTGSSPTGEEGPDGNATGWLHAVPGQGGPSRNCSLLWMAWSAVLQSAALHPSTFWELLSGELIHTSVLISSLLMARCHIPFHIHREPRHMACWVGPAVCLQPRWASLGSICQQICIICLTGGEG